MDDIRTVSTLAIAVGVGIWVATMEYRLQDAERGVDVDAVAASLAANHTDTLRGEPGLKGDQGPKGDPGEPGSNAEFPEGAVVAFLRECSAFPGWAPYYPAAGRVLVGAGPHAPEGDDSRNRSGAVNDAPPADLAVYDGPGDLPDEQLRSAISANVDGRDRVGGAETYTLTAEEIPEHRHSGTTDAMNRTDHVVMENVGPHSSNDHFIGHSGRGPDRNPKVNEYPPGASHRHGFGTDIDRNREIQPHNNMPPYVALYFCKKER